MLAMKQFTSVHDVTDLDGLVREALALRQDPSAFPDLGRFKTLGLVFLNPSLRTRISTQQAGMNLGLQVQVIQAGTDAWSWEFAEGGVMDGTTVEHVKDAAKVLSRYCDIIGIRCFPGLKDRDFDYGEHVLNAFLRYADVPVVSLESATRHPLQSLADLVTIRHDWGLDRPPVVALTWAPHIKPLPQAVANSFSEWMIAAGLELRIANPPGYDLQEDFTRGATICHDQAAALDGADYVYVKNWSSYEEYGAMPPVESNWLLDGAFEASHPQTRFMHCLPVRRNLEMTDALLDSSRSLIYEQAANRTPAAQAVLRQILTTIS